MHHAVTIHHMIVAFEEGSAQVPGPFCSPNTETPARTPSLPGDMACHLSPALSPGGKVGLVK